MLTILYITFGLMIISVLVVFQVLTNSSGTIELNHLAVAAEMGIETRQGGEREENNAENGFSPDEHTSVTQSANKSVQSTDLQLSSLIAQGTPVIANHSAPITIVEFGDFQCHFCARFAKQIEPSLNSTYIQSGKANLVFKHFVTHDHYLL